MNGLKEERKKEEHENPASHVASQSLTSDYPIIAYQPACCKFCWLSLWFRDHGSFQDQGPPVVWRLQPIHI